MELCIAPSPQATPRIIGAGNSWLGGVDISFGQDHLTITNTADRPFILNTLTVSGNEKDVMAMIDAGKSVELEISGYPQSVGLCLYVMLRYDMIIPRRMALVRHRAARFSSQHVFGYPIVALSPVHSPEREESLRQKLANKPDDAQTAMALAMMLIARKESYEAERWLDMALKRRDQLVDDGVYAELLLDYVHSEIKRITLFTEEDVSDSTEGMTISIVPSKSVRRMSIPASTKRARQFL